MFEYIPTSARMGIVYDLSYLAAIFVRIIDANSLQSFEQNLLFVITQFAQFTKIGG